MTDVFICRLFRQDRPFEQAEARILSEGELTVGRDPSADWPLPDQDGTLSRIHCTLAFAEGRLTLTDRSTNGVFLDSGLRAPRDEPVELRARDSIRLGAFSILIDRPDPAVIDGAATTLHAPVPVAAIATPADWSDGPATPRAFRDASLLEAFCDGAKLDASVFSSEEPEELMRRIGAVYQQTVLGLSTLMAERARVKGEHHLERTTISAADNNPFKWAPSRKLAQDLLRSHGSSFLSDADAVRASFADIGRHLSAVAEGANAVADLAANALAPKDIEAEAKTQGSLLRTQASVCWEVLGRRHADLIDEGRKDGSLKKAFSDAYARVSDSPSL